MYKHYPRSELNITSTSLQLIPKPESIFVKLGGLFAWRIISLLLLALLLHPQASYAYTTNMSASVVVGQVDFSGGSTNQGGSASANTMANPYDAIIAGEKLIVSDNSNHRVLIYNKIPTTNNAAADVVIGQANFTSTSANRGSSANRNANTINSPQGISSDGTRLFIADGSNHRVLIFNTIPTSSSASADVVIGQQNFTSGSSNQGTTVAANTLNSPIDVWVSGSKLFIVDSSNHRILIYNSIPTTNNASADIVVGQTNMTSNSPNQGGSPAANTLWFPGGVFTDNGKLIIGEIYFSGNGNKRLLVYNSIPTSNNVSADVVIGQPNFSSNSANQGGSAGANTLYSTRLPWSYNGRLFIPEDQGNNRILIYNSIPTTNNASADMVIGQPNFSSTSANQGSSKAANTVNRPTGGFATAEKLVVADRINSRILIYDNIIKQPSLTLNRSPIDREDDQVRLYGNATVDSPYKLKNVEFSLNGSSFNGAIATDGTFDETSEEYYFDFRPTSNQLKDRYGSLIDGYTIHVKSTNNNADFADMLFYFKPFDLHSPSDNETSATAYPTFEFSVSKQRENIRDNLSRYQIKVRKGGGDSAASWDTLIDDIPVDFRSVKNSVDNMRSNVYGHLDTDNGVYETDKLYAIYSEESSRIRVYSKLNPLVGTYQWRAVAVDKAGHNQETDIRNLFVRAISKVSASNDFPLAVLHISGVGNPHLNTYDLSGVESTYHTSSSNPVFYGIAWSNSEVTLKLTEQDCRDNCTKTYSTIANAESRYGINVPKEDVNYGKIYSAKLSVALEDKYNELPQFFLSIDYPITGVTKEVAKSDAVVPEVKGVHSSPSPTATLTPTKNEHEVTSNNKRCIWFACW